MTQCFRCDIEIETTLPGSVQNALCDDCKARLQRKVDAAARDLEFEMVNGSFRRKRAASPARAPDWSVPGVAFMIGVGLREALHLLGWWK